MRVCHEDTLKDTKPSLYLGSGWSEYVLYLGSGWSEHAKNYMHLETHQSWGYTSQAHCFNDSKTLLGGDKRASDRLSPAHYDPSIYQVWALSVQPFSKSGMTVALHVRTCSGRRVCIHQEWDDFACAQIPYENPKFISCRSFVFTWRQKRSYSNDISRKLWPRRR